MRFTKKGTLHQQCMCQQRTEEDTEQSLWTRSPVLGVRVGGGVSGLSLAVPQVSAHTGSVGHGMSDVVLLMDALEEVGHGSTGQHRHILPTMGGRLRGHRGQLDVVLGFWKTQENHITPFFLLCLSRNTTISVFASHPNFATYFNRLYSCYDQYFWSTMQQNTKTHTNQHIMLLCVCLIC